MSDLPPPPSLIAVNTPRVAVVGREPVRSLRPLVVAFGDGTSDDVQCTVRSESLDHGGTLDLKQLTSISLLSIDNGKNMELVLDFKFTDPDCVNLPDLQPHLIYRIMPQAFEGEGKLLARGTPVTERDFRKEYKHVKTFNGLLPVESAGIVLQALEKSNSREFDKKRRIPVGASVRDNPELVAVGNGIIANAARVAFAPSARPSFDLMLEALVIACPGLAILPPGTPPLTRRY